FTLFNLNPYFAKRPWDVWEWLVTSPAASENRAGLLHATTETLGVAFPGYFAGLLFGVALAISFSLSTRMRQMLTPFAIALRCVPIIAVAPLVVAALGRGSTGIIIVVAIMTFFPTLVSCLYGLGQMPGQISDVFQIYSASRGRTLLLGRFPSMLPAFFAAARI